MDETFETRLSGLLQDVEGLAAAYLFGSRARRSARPESDLDLGVLFASPPPATLSGPMSDLRRELDRAMGCEIDLVDLHRAPVDLVHRILREGTLLVDPDPSRRIRFEVQARNAYFDLLPYLREYRRRETA